LEQTLGRADAHVGGEEHLLELLDDLRIDLLLAREERAQPPEEATALARLGEALAEAGDVFRALRQRRTRRRARAVCLGRRSADLGRSGRRFILVVIGRGGRRGLRRGGLGCRLGRGRLGGGLVGRLGRRLLRGGLGLLLLVLLRSGLGLVGLRG